MSDLATSSQDQQRTPDKPQRALKITKQVRAAIHAMVWDGLKRDKAAAHAGMKDNSLYVALRRPDVKAFYLSELEVLRTSERARNVHRLAEIRDAGNNMPAVQAIGMLERMSADDSPSNPGASPSPGVTIRIINQAPAPPPTIDVSPTIRHTADTREQIDE